MTRHSILDRWCDVKMSESALKRKFQHESDEMSSKNQRVDDFDAEVLKGFSLSSSQRLKSCFRKFPHSEAKRKQKTARN